MKKEIMIFLSTAVVLIAASGNCSAKEVPVELTLPVTANIDVSVGYDDGSGIVNDRIRMTGQAESPVLDISSLIIKNNAAMGTVRVQSLEAAGIKDRNGNQWTIVPDGTGEMFAALEADSFVFSMVAEGEHDLSNGTVELKKEVLPGTRNSITFSGKTGPSTKAYENETVARVVVTLGLV